MTMGLWKPSMRSNMVWWLRIGAEASIAGGATMLQTFKNIKLPRLLLPHTSGWNFSAYHPFFAAGPVYFCYTPPKTMDLKQALFTMFFEENEKAEGDEAIISSKLMQKIVKAYKNSYEQGDWLNKRQKQTLTLRKKSMF